MISYDVLKEAGLTEGEIKVYTALLQLGPSSTGPIIDKSGIARSISYQILEKLIAKGLVSYVTKGNTKYYRASSPDKILEYIDEKQTRITENKKEVAKLLPMLSSLMHQDEETQVNVYEGFHGIQVAHENTYKKLTKNEEYVYFGIPDYQDEKYHLYWNKDHKKRIKAGITCKLLFNKSTPQETLDNRKQYKGCIVRKMATDVKTPSWFLIYKDTTVIGLPKKDIAIEIVDEEITQSFMEYFEFFWQQAKP